MASKHGVVKHVVTSGNYGLATAGQEVFTRSGSDINYNIPPGQIVAFTYSNGTTTTVDHTTLASSDISSLFLGVGVDTNGDGATDDIRYLGIEDVSGCYIDTVRSSSPQCGSPQIKDFLFDCTECGETYTAMVSVDDNSTRSYSKWNKSEAEFVGSAVATCFTGVCDDCDPTPDCNEIACKLADELNNKLVLDLGTDSAGNAVSYPDFKEHNQERPYWVTRLHDNSFVYCLSPQTVSGSCTKCTYINDITQATINGQTVSFTGTTDPADSTRTLIAQLQSVVNQINQGFIDEIGYHSGSAYFTGGYSECCPLELHVNTCDENFTIGDGQTTLTPTSSTNPLNLNVPIPNRCADCDEDDQTVTFTCGLRVIAERISGNCGCLIEQPLSFYGRKVDIKPIANRAGGNPWKSWHVEPIQDMALPANFGAHIQWLEYHDQKPGGRARKYNRSNYNRGWIEQPDDTSRAKQASKADCKEDYCSYYMRTYYPSFKVSGERDEIQTHSTIHIPSGDSTTIAAWENFLDALIGFNPACKVVSTISCTTDYSSC